MNVLLPTDFSAGSLATFETGEAIAGQFGGLLTVCHVLGPGGDLPLGYLSAPVSRVVPTSQEIDFHYRMQAHGRSRQADKRRQLLSRLESVAPRGAARDLLLGDVASEISAAAASHDLLLMTWGEVTRQVFEKTRTPVLCLAPGSNLRSLSRVVIGTDFSRAADRAVEWCGRLPEHGVELFLAHVTPRPAGDAVGKRLMAMAASAGAQAELRTGTAGEELPRLASELEAELIAIGGKARPGFLEALLRGTQRTLLGGGGALLVVPR